MDIKNIIEKSINQIPRVEGPIPCTKDSHPFCDMKHSRTPFFVSDFGYCEEEYFLESTVNIYGADMDDMPVLKKEGIPYKNRILVRKPLDMSKFSGRVYIDIMNATQGYDIEDLWHRIYLWCMENGHGYVGITSKPINVMSLKNFDYNRYKSLNWSNGESLPQPIASKYHSVPGTEEGMFWDMLGQLSSLIRYGGDTNCFNGVKVSSVYLTGQSQSGAYLNTYIHYFDQFAYDDQHKKLYDGYFNIVGALVQRQICQQEGVGALKLIGRNVRPTDTPFISISSEGDFSLFNLFFSGNLFAFKIPNADAENNKCRNYEIAATPHTDIICPVLTDFEEIAKTTRPLPNLDESFLSTLNDIPTEYYLCGLLEKLHNWSKKHIAPEIMPALERNNEGLLRDEFGNVRGGLRSPFVDVPIATYLGCHPNDPEGISGKMTYFTQAQFLKLYSDVSDYLEKFSNYTDAQVKDGWISESDGKKMKLWAQKAALRFQN